MPAGPSRVKPCQRGLCDSSLRHPMNYAGLTVSRRITMSQLLLWCNAISDQSLQFLRLRKSAFLLTGKDDLAFESDVQDAALARNRGHLPAPSQTSSGVPGPSRRPAGASGNPCSIRFQFEAYSCGVSRASTNGRSGGHMGRAPLVCSGDCNSRWGTGFASSGLGEQFTATDSNTAASQFDLRLSLSLFTTMAVRR